MIQVSTRTYYNAIEDARRYLQRNSIWATPESFSEALKRSLSQTTGIPAEHFGNLEYAPKPNGHLFRLSNTGTIRQRKEDDQATS